MTGTIGDTEVYRRYWAALEKGETATAVNAVLDAHEAGAAMSELLDAVVCAAQAEVGRRWAADEWNVAQEHRATSISEEAVAALSARIDVVPTRGQILVTCADGEWHSLPSRVLSADLRQAGWHVSYLGASVPVANVAQFLHDVGPDIVALSCMLPTRLFRARGVIEASRDAGVPVLVGGRGFGTDGRWGMRLGADAWAATARDALRTLETMPSFTDAAPPHTAPDETIAAVQNGRARIIAESTRMMREQLTDIAGYDAHRLRHTGVDVGNIIDFLVAALFVDDEVLFTDFMAWLADILQARDVQRSTLSAGTRLVADAISAECGDRREIARLFAAGIAVVEGPVS